MTALMVVCYVLGVMVTYGVARLTSPDLGSDENPHAQTLTALAAVAWPVVVPVCLVIGLGVLFFAGLEKVVEKIRR